MERKNNKLYFSRQEQALLPGRIPASVNLSDASLLSAHIQSEVQGQQTDAANRLDMDSEHAARTLFGPRNAVQAYALAELINAALATK